MIGKGKIAPDEDDIRLKNSTCAWILNFYWFHELGSVGSTRSCKSCWIFLGRPQITIWLRRIEKFPPLMMINLKKEPLLLVGRAVVLQPSGVVCYLPFVNWSHRDYDRIGRNASTPKISHTNLGIGRVHQTMSIH